MTMSCHGVRRLDKLPCNVSDWQGTYSILTSQGIQSGGLPLHFSPPLSSKLCLKWFFSASVLNGSSIDIRFQAGHCESMIHCLLVSSVHMEKSVVPLIWVLFYMMSLLMVFLVGVVDLWCWELNSGLHTC